MNRLSLGTSFQQLGRVPGRGEQPMVESEARLQPKRTYQAHVDTSLRWCGPPEILVVDQGVEFQGYFAKQSAGHPHDDDNS